MPSVGKGKQYTKRYSEEQIKEALNAIKAGMPKKTASKQYGVPRSTLQFRLSDNFTKIRPGPATVLSEEEENMLVTWIKECSSKGFPQRKLELKLSVQHFLEKNKRPNPFKNNLPGEKWYTSFMKRHQELTLRTSEAVTSASANVAKVHIKTWFEKIEHYLKGAAHFEILQDPSRVFNGDETNFLLCPKNEKVLAEKGSKNVYEIDRGQAKAAITVMFTFSAAGECTPPMIIYPYKRLPTEILSSVPNDWGVGKTETGWMKSEVFYEYIGNVLHPYLVSKDTQFPIILFVDGHKSHLTYEISTLCDQLKIILIALYPNATRILQPADVSAFKPLKNEWKKSVLVWRQKNPNDALTKFNFATVLKEAVDNLKPAAIAAGFTACGLYPWNSDNVDYSKCLGKSASETNDAIKSNDIIKINKNMFEKVVTRETMDKLKEDESSNDSSELKSLRKIWSILVNNEDDKQDQKRSEEQNVTICENQSLAVIERQIEEEYNAIISAEKTNLNSILDIETMPVVLGDLLPVEEIVGSREEQHNLPSTEQIVFNTEEQNTSLSQSLLWPKTPEKKGKRNNNQNMPYVLTSKDWQEIHRKKKEEKEREENRKQEKRREREINKENKEKQTRG